jgi:hypothetical protein
MRPEDVLLRGLGVLSMAGLLVGCAWTLPSALSVVPQVDRGEFVVRLLDGQQVRQ